MLFSCPSCLMPLPASCSPLPPAWLQMKGFWKYISVGRTEEDAGIKPRTVFAIMGVSTGVGGTQGGRGKGGGVDGGAGSGKVAEAGSACQYTEAGTGSATDRPCLCLRPCTCCCFRCCLPVQDAGRDPGYWSTARMVLECGLCLAQDERELLLEGMREGGVLTPARWDDGWWRGCGSFIPRCVRTCPCSARLSCGLSSMPPAVRLPAALPCSAGGLTLVNRLRRAGYACIVRESHGIKI